MNSPETFRPAKPHSATRHLFRSVPWVVLEAGFNVVHGLSSVFAIGLLVPPGELGKASVALSTVLFIESFTSMGLQEAVIRSRSGDTITTDTAFCLALCFALAGVLLATIAAFPLGYLYDDYQITSLLLSSSSLLPLNALTLVPAAKLARKLRGGTLTKRMILGKFAGLATLFLFGLLGAGAWAVVVSAIATSAGGLFVLTLFATRFPRLRFDRPKARELLGFGVIQSLENVFWSATYRIFGILLGYLHGSVALGYFYFAQRLVEEMASMLQLLVNRFALSFFAGLERAASSGATIGAFIAGTRVLTSVAAPAFALLAFFAEDVLIIFFGHRWDPAGPLIAILSIGWIFAFPRVLVGPMLRARGDQMLVLYYAGLSCAFTLLACIASARYPLFVVALAWTTRHLIAIPWSAWVVHYRLGIAYKTLAELTIRPLLAVFAMSVVILAVGYIVPSLERHLQLAIQVTIGLIVYACTIYFVDRESLNLMRRIAYSVLGRARL